MSRGLLAVGIRWMWFGKMVTDGLERKVIYHVKIATAQAEENSACAVDLQ